jgi:hypothetical protein
MFRVAWWPSLKTKFEEGNFTDFSLPGMKKYLEGVKCSVYVFDEESNDVSANVRRKLKSMGASVEDNFAMGHRSFSHLFDCILVGSFASISHLLLPSHLSSLLPLPNR